MNDTTLYPLYIIMPLVFDKFSNKYHLNYFSGDNESVIYTSKDDAIKQLDNLTNNNIQVNYGMFKLDRITMITESLIEKVL